MLNFVRRYFVTCEVERTGGGDVHRDVMRNGFERRIVLEARGRVHIDENANAAAEVDVYVHNALIAREAANADFFTNLGDHFVQRRADGESRREDRVLRKQSVHVRGVLLADLLGELGDIRLEIIGLGDKVRFAVDFDHDANAAIGADIAADDAFRGNAARFFRGGREALFAQIVLGFFKIAFTLGERLFTVHHAGLRQFAQGHDIFCGKHAKSSLWIEWSGDAYS